MAQDEEKFPHVKEVTRIFDAFCLAFYSFFLHADGHCKLLTKRDSITGLFFKKL
jgi:hypothetical protein